MSFRRTIPIFVLLVLAIALVACQSNAPAAAVDVGTDNDVTETETTVNVESAAAAAAGVEVEAEEVAAQDPVAPSVVAAWQRPGGRVTPGRRSNHPILEARAICRAGAG